MGSPSTSNARPYEGNGHYYAFTSKKIKWWDALTESEQTWWNGTGGYLATITSSGENSFIRDRSQAGSAITNSAFIGGTDSNDRGTWEGRWIWYGQNAPENGTVFRDGGTNYGYANWNGGEPNNKHNQDFAQFYTSGYWDDVDPDNVGGYISEWGKGGAEYFLTVSTSNGTEGQSNPSLTISPGREIRSDYKNIYNGTPLIDIPLTVTSNDSNYSINVKGGSSYYSNGRLYLLGVGNGGTVTVEFVNNDNDTWQPLRGFDVNLGADGGENIYTFGTNANTSSAWDGQVWLFDNEPQLSLGQGAWQTIDTYYTSNQTIQGDLIIFDEDGIDENDTTFGNLGLYDNFGIQWETYVRIPKDGNYTFKLTSDDGANLSIRKDNPNGSLLGNISCWKDQGSTTYSTGAVNGLKAGDVVWVQLDYYENKGATAAKLLWNDGSGDAIIPASAMFLSQQLASGQLASASSNPGTDQQEPWSGKTNKPGFQIFANQNSGNLNIKLSSSSETKATTVPAETNTAQRQFDSTKDGDDYILLSDSGSVILENLIDTNGSYTGNYGWTPNTGGQNNIKNLFTSVLSDPYAEAAEHVTLSLKESSGYGVLNDGATSSTVSQSLDIIDNPFVLSLRDVQNTTEGELGWITIDIGEGKTAPESGMRVFYEISTTSTADEGDDYLAPKATLSTTSFNPQNYVFLEPNASSGKIYISALADTISENDETVTVRLLPDAQTTDEGFNYQMYNVGSNDTATLTITDSGLYSESVVITPKGRTGISTIRSTINSDGVQTTNFDLHLTSKPEEDVSVELTPSSGSLSSKTIIFTPANWSEAQTISLTGQSAEELTTVSAVASSSDSTYSNKGANQTIVPSGWPDDLIVTLWEGGESNPILPSVAVQANQGSEDANSQLGFTFRLSSALSNDLSITYTLTEGSGFELIGTEADVLKAPTSQSDGQYTITIPAGLTEVCIALIPVDDNLAEGDETITATLIPSDAYSIGGETSSAIASLVDNDLAEVSFLIATDENVETDNEWTEANQIRTSESLTAAGQSSLVGLALTSRPSKPVTLTLDPESFSTNDLLITNPSSPNTQPSLIFTPDNWNESQTLSLEAVDENIDDNDKIIQVSFTVDSDDPGYSSIAPSLSVTVVDNDATEANDDLADPDINSNDPLATLSAPSELKFAEDSEISSKFNISIEKSSDVDRIIFLDLDSQASDGDPNNLILTPYSSNGVASGLTLFTAVTDSPENISLDLDGIYETADTFSDLNLTGDFSTTWSGYIYIPESGYYNFSTALSGGTRLSIDGELIIDEYYDADAHWTSQYLEFKEGDFVSIELDYRSFGSPDPRIELLWERPNDHGGGYTEETLPANALSRVGGKHLILEAGETTASFTVAAKDDNIKENNETYAFELLAARGVEIKVSTQTKDELGNITLGLTLGTTDVEAITLPANTVLSLGEDQGADGEQSESLATFTLQEDTTIHRDRDIETKGILVLADPSAVESSVVGMVGAENQGQYQVLDAFVDINLESQLIRQSDSQNKYTTTLRLEETNRESITLPANTLLPYTAPDLNVELTLSSPFTVDEDDSDLYQVTLLRSDANNRDVTLPAGTTLTYNIEDDDQTFNLTLQDTITLETSQTLKDVTVQVSNATDGLEITSIQVGLTSSTSIQQSFSLKLEDELTLLSGESVNEILVTAKDVTEGLDLATVDPGITSSFTPDNPSIIKIQDDDKAGVNFTIDAGGGTVIDNNTNINLVEEGEGVTRYAALTSQPTNSVTLYLETNDATEVLLQNGEIDDAPILSRIALTFTPENWNERQAFNILPADDLLRDGDISAAIFSRTNSSDPFYQETDGYSVDKVASIPIINADNEIADVQIELQQSVFNETENGFLNFSLTAEPSENVVISLTPSDHQFTLNQRGIGQSETLTFTPSNWDVLQTLELNAVDDGIVEDITESLLEINITSKDTNYDSKDIDPVTIEIIDNDLPTASIIPVSDSSEEAEPGRFRIELSEPAPSSAGSNGIVVNYNITDLQVDTDKLQYPSDPSSIDKITQFPGSTTGQVRIAPGQKSSEVFVVPIDDFVADSFDKSFTIGLTSGEGYLLDESSLTNKATVQIINNDVAGMIILLSGDPLQVSETGNPGQFSIALLSQPGGDVSLTLEELKSEINGTSVKQLGSSKNEEFSQTLNFTSDNWFIAQTVSVTAYDDYIIEDTSSRGDLVTYNSNGKPVDINGTEITDPELLLSSGLHPAQLKYTFTSTDSDYSTESHAGDANHFTNTIQDVDVLDIQLPDTTADSLQNALTNLQEGIDSLALPIVGSLNGKTGGGLRKFITNLANSIRAIGTPTPAKISQLISDEINEATGLENVTVTLEMIDDDGDAAIDVGFNFADSYDVLNIPLDANFGLPGLGLQSQGSLEADFDYGANLKFHFPREGEAELITDPEETYLSANFVTNLSDDFSLTGGLGFLQLDAQNQPSPNEVAEGLKDQTTGMSVDFNLDLAGGAGDDGSLTWTELTDSKTDLEELFQYTINGDAAMSFGVVTSVEGSAAIPSLSFDLSSLLPLFDYSNIKEEEESGAKTKTDFYFDNINLDLGTYITQMLNPIVNGIDDILNPLYPIVDALYANTQIFDTIGLTKTFDKDKDGHVSPIDLAEWFADLYAIIQPGEEAENLKETIEDTIEFLDVVKGVMDLMRNLEEMADEGSFYVEFGSYALSDFSAGDPEAETPVVPDQEKSPDDPSTEGLSKDTQEQADAGGNSDPDNPEDGESNSSFAEIMGQLDELGFAIPLIDDPTNAINLLLGNEVDLFTWRMPSMGMSSEIEESFPIYSGVDGIIEGGFGVDANIGFGFDTTGLQEWMDDEFSAEDFWKVFNGFYVNDRNDAGVDIPEFTLDASMGAGLGFSAVVVRADITGGLEAEASLDLLDEGEIAGTDDGKIYGDEITSRLDNPLDLFELIGSLSAYLQAKVKIGIDMGFYSIWDTVWQEKLAEIPIFEFGVGGSYGSGTVSNGYLSGSTVFFDANFNGRIDSLEPSMVVGDDSHYKLKVDHRDFDTNRNGTIDPSEGRLVVFGGIDTSTGLPLEIPMLAPLGDMLTPLTTLHALALELGYSDDDIKERLNRIFDLKNFDYLNEDPLLGIKGAASIDRVAIQGNLAAYTSHIELMVGLNIFARTLKKAFHDAENNNQHDTELLRSFTKALFDNTTEESDSDTAIRDALRNAISNMHPDASADDTAYLNAIASFAATASAEVGARLKQLRETHSSDAQTGNPADFLSALHGLKTEILNAYNSNTHLLSEGLYRITDPKERLNALGSRLEAAHGDFIQLTKPTPSPSPTPSPTPSPAPTPSPEPEQTPDPTPAPSDELPADVSDLSADDITRLTPEAVSDLSADQVNELPPEAVQGFTADQVSELSDEAVAAFSPRQVKQLSPDAVSALSTSQVSELSTKAVRGFTGDQLEQLPKRSFKALESVQLAKLSKDAVTGLTSRQLRTLAGDEIAAFRPGRIKSISPGSISGVRPATLDDLNKRQIKALTTEQLAALSKKQIRKADDFIDSLSDQQREALSFGPGPANRLVDPLSNQDVLALMPGFDPLA